MKKRHHPLWRTWCGMRERCNNPNKDRYAYYGGRGITVAPEWDDFDTFVSDMGPRPDGYQLDRIDPDGPYCRENCRWVSRIDQANNKRNNVLYTFNGVTKTRNEWGREYGIKPHTLTNRVNRGWNIEKALTCPVR